MTLDDQQDVSTDSSPENNEQQPDSTPEADPAEPSAEPAQKSEDNVPFHLHPRFQEVIHEKNSLKEQLQAQAKALEELRSQMKSATPAEKDELMERLEGIDPKFAGMLKNMRDELAASKQALEELRSWRDTSSQETVAERISNVKERFYSDNKIPAERREIYEAMVNAAAQADKKLTVNDLPAVMKRVHESLGKMFQANERDTAKKFVDGKKAEAAKPAAQKNGVPAKATKPEQNLSRDQLRAQMLKEVADEVRANKDI